MTVPVIVAGVLLIAIVVFLLIAWADSANTAHYNKQNWERAAYMHREELEGHLRWKEECANSDKRANEQEARADGYLEKLRRYGLEDMP